MAFLTERYNGGRVLMDRTGQRENTLIDCVLGYEVWEVLDGPEALKPPKVWNPLPVSCKSSMVSRASSMVLEPPIEIAGTVFSVLGQPRGSLCPSRSGSP
jgi:hypothetical protein